LLRREEWGIVCYCAVYRLCSSGFEREERRKNLRKIDLCPHCGVPVFVGRELRWRENGVISLARAPRNRMVLFESTVIDNLFRGIEELIGVSIEHIVIESRRREVRRYIEGLFPWWLRRFLPRFNDFIGSSAVLERMTGRARLSMVKAVAGRVFDVGKIYGYGTAGFGSLLEAKDIHPWRKILMRKPYSVLFFAAEALASVEAFEARDFWVSYRMVEEDLYEFSFEPGEHPLELKERLQRDRYPFKPGEVDYERCPSCGVPVEVGRLRWNVEEGTIHDPETGWRMALFGPHSVGSVLHDLEAELGDAIPEAVVEAQRRYVKSKVAGRNWRRSAATFSRWTAYRGMGNISRFEVDDRHLTVVIENSCLPLLVLGTAQAIYEVAMGKEKSSCEWELKEDGDFHFTVSL
jgi:hypothetical protein